MRVEPWCFDCSLNDLGGLNRGTAGSRLERVAAWSRRWLRKLI